MVSISMKITRWMEAMTTTRPDQIPRIPKICLRDSPVEASIKDFYGTRDWEFCAAPTCRRSGNQFKLMKCAGCCAYSGRYALYCSKRCQCADRASHQDYCDNAAKYAAQVVSKIGVDVRVWKNCGRRSFQRREGMKMIIGWAFGQIYTSHPNINWSRICLSIHYSSAHQGKGSIIPMSYQLIPVDLHPYGPISPQTPPQDSGTTIGVLHFNIDGIWHDPLFVDLMAFRDISFYKKQWPWIFATIVAMKNYHGELGSYRLLQLDWVVHQLITHNKVELFHFQVPENIDDGEMWELPDFDKWQQLFGHRVLNGIGLI